MKLPPGDSVWEAEFERAVNDLFMFTALFLYTRQAKEKTIFTTCKADINMLK